MNIDIDKFSYPDNVPDFSKEKVLYADYINIVDTKQNKLIKGVLVMTDWEIFFFSIKSKSKLTKEASMRWYDLKRLVMEDNKTFSCCYKKKKQGQDQESSEIVMKIEYRKTNSLLKRMHKYLSTFMMKNELPEFQFLDGVDMKETKGKFLLFLKMKMREINKPFSKSSYEGLKKMLIENPIEVDLSLLSFFQGHINIFLTGLNLCPTIKKLIIRFENENKILDEIIAFIKTNQTIESFSFYGKLPANFKDFVKELKNSKAPINEVVFNDCEFDLSNISDLKNIVTYKKIESLRLYQSIAALVVNPLVLKFESKKGFQNITNLFLDKTPGLNVRLLVPSLTNVQTLSLSYCDFELVDFFSELSESPNFQLQRVNLSGNRNSRSFDQVVLPKYLYDISLNDILWDRDSLLIFIETICKHNPVSFINEEENRPTKLSISNLKLPPGKWDDFFEDLSEIASDTLSSLRWDDNPIQPHLIKFLSNISNLNALSLSGCIEPESKILKQVIKYINENRTIETFAMSGTQKQILGSSTIELVKILEKNRTIKKLDISKNRAGEELLNVLKDLLRDNCKIETILIDGNNVFDIKSYIDFFQALVNRGQPLFIPWPEKEVNDMIQYDSATEIQLQSAKETYDQVIAGNPNIKPPREAFEYLNDPPKQKKEKQKLIIMKDSDSDVTPPKKDKKKEEPVKKEESSEPIKPKKTKNEVVIKSESSSEEIPKKKNKKNVESETKPKKMKEDSDSKKKISNKKSKRKEEEQEEIAHKKKKEKQQEPSEDERPKKKSRKNEDEHEDSKHKSKKKESESSNDDKSSRRSKRKEIEAEDISSHKKKGKKQTESSEEEKPKKKSRKIEDDSDDKHKKKKSKHRNEESDD